ncbi:MAG: hypothetical protein AB8C40_06825 [Gammaproteobacteria bacterium]
MLSLYVAHSTLHAANQGELSSSSSRGSMKISLVIPEFTRLVADLDTTVSLQDPGLCMHVVKRPSHSSTNFYRVAGLINTQSSDYESQLVEIENATQLVQLENNYNPSRSIQNICDYQSELVTKLKNKKNRTALLVLISE